MGPDGPYLQPKPLDKPIPSRRPTAATNPDDQSAPPSSTSYLASFVLPRAPAADLSPSPPPESAAPPSKRSRRSFLSAAWPFPSLTPNVPRRQSSDDDITHHFQIEDTSEAVSMVWTSYINFYYFMKPATPFYSSRFAQATRNHPTTTLYSALSGRSGVRDRRGTSVSSGNQ